MRGGFFDFLRQKLCLTESCCITDKQLFDFWGQVAMSRYRRSGKSYRPNDLDHFINSITAVSQYKPSWVGDFQDFYHAPSIKELEYIQYRYVSKLAVLADAKSLNRFSSAQFRVSEIERVLWQQVINDPFEPNASDFAAPRVLRSIFPDPPTDPRPLLSSRRPNPSPPPARPTPSTVKAA